MINIYTINYDRLAELLLPTFLRKPKMRAFVFSLLGGVQDVFVLFNNNRISNLNKIQYNGQICYLRKVLNDSFDPSAREIQVTDGNRFERTYIYTPVEYKPQYIYTAVERKKSPKKVYFVRRNADFDDTGKDFRVIIPPTIDLKKNAFQLHAMIDFYKLASKTYIIEQ